jgi:phosphoglycolate phosphatase/AHBA synthesis associated protein
MVLEAVLFDMDGVLVKSEEAWYRVVSDAGVKYRGRAISREEFFPTFGQGTRADIPVFGLSCTFEELDAFYAAHFLDHLDAMWVNPDAAPLLEALRARGLRTALVTNTIGPLAKAVLTQAGLLELFDALGTSDRVAHAKPAPDLVQLACRDLGVAPQAAWMVGDSKYDRGAAGAAGVHFIGFGIDGDVRVDALPQILPLAEAAR